MSKKIRVQMIGNYLESLERPLRRNGILVESLIGSCSPLAMEGSMDKAYLKYCKDINHMPTQLDLRKNLSRMLSKNADDFSQNYILQPEQTNVRYQNKSEYLIFMNTISGYCLFEKDGTVYSDVWPQNSFTKEIKEDKTYKVRKFPFTEDFNWKYYYDKFINAIIKEYDRDHIILIKVNSSQWYMNNQEIEAFDIKSAWYRNRVEQMDQYFIEKTHCICIEEHFNHIPPSYTPCAFSYGRMSKFTYKCLENIIVNIINNNRSDNYRVESSVYGNLFADFLRLRMSKDVFTKNIKYIEYIQESEITFYDIAHDRISTESEFFSDLTKLKKFFNPEDKYTLSDYVRDARRENIDLEIVEKYVRYMKLDINDMIAVYMIYVTSEEKLVFKKIVENIICNRSCLPVKSALQFRNDNISYLRKYPFLYIEIKECSTDRIYVRLENNSYLVLNALSDCPITKIEVNVKDFVDYRQVIKDGYRCTIEYADALCSNLAFYIERARWYDGNRPIQIFFDSQESFLETLNYIDYSDILENERFILSIKGLEPIISDYRAVCNLSFLFRENVKIFYLGNGFNDQIRFYVLAKLMQEVLGGDVYFEDIYSCYYKNCLNGCEEIKKVVTEELDSCLLSKLFSVKLLEYFCTNFDKMQFPGILYENGFTEIVGYTTAYRVATSFKAPVTVFKIPSMEFSMRFFENIYNKGCSYYHCYAYLYELMAEKNYDISKYIRFPEFNDQRNIEIQEKMLSSDAVVIHFRRGDYISFLLGKDAVSDENYTDYNFYVEAIKKLQKLDEYSNKMYFIFSDDIKWVKEHYKYVGLDIIDDSKVYYIDHNKDEDSFKDMQLMMNGKIMIISHSGLANLSAFLSTRCEVLASMRGNVIRKFQNVKKQYKYDLEPLPRGRFENMS